MKTFLLTLNIILFSTVCFTQNSIKGNIFSENQDSVEAAVIFLINSENDTFLKAEVSDADGNFNFKSVENGSYKIEVKSLGFKDYSSNVFTLNNNNKDFGIITLSEETEKLDEVLLKVEKPMIQVMADKTVFNVQNSLSSIGETGFELLRKAPGVFIDNNNGIVVEGKSGVLIYINNKPSVLRGQDLVNYLNTIQASDIKAVEIITQPSSKYDADGNAGIINIILKRDTSLGTNGSVSSGITVGDFARTNNSLSFNTRTKALNLFGTYSNNFGKSTNFLYLNRTQDEVNYNARTNSVYDNNSNNLRLGLDVYASQNSTFGALFTGNFSNFYGNSNTRTPITPNNQNSPAEVLVAESKSDNTTSNLFGNINYKYKDTLGYSLNMDLDYGKYDSQRENLQPNRFFNGNETQLNAEIIRFFDTPIKIDIVSTQLDYEQPFLKGVLALGAKYAKIKTDNSFDVYDRTDGMNDLDEERSNDFSYDERILAAYFNYNRKFDKLNVQFGLRMENTDSDGRLTSDQANVNDRVTRNYTNWFPSGGLTYSLNRKNSLALIYSKRIQRPNYQSLNPFQYRLDELSFRQGNPFLQPQYTDNIKLSHTYNYRLTTSLSYSFTSDFFAQVTEPGDNGSNFINIRNVANNKVINISVSYPTKINDWWDIYASVSAFRSIYEATNPDFLGTAQNTLSLYAQNTFKFPKDYSIELSGWYSSPSVWGGTYQTKSLGSLNLAFQKRFLDDKLSARLSLNDILFTSPWRGTTQFGDLFIDGSGGSDSRQVRFNLSYNFGRNEIKKARRRSTGVEDEKGRID